MNVDFIAGGWGEVGEDGGECLPGYRHGHIVSVIVICRLELNHVGLDVGVGIDLPGGPEASGSDL